MITSRSRYALKIMMDLAKHEDLQQRRHDISSRHGIPADYMDHILASLREGGLVESIRGRNGGLKIGRPALEITVWDIFQSAETNMQPVACLDTNYQCSILDACISKSAWGEIYAAMRTALSLLSLKSLADKYESTDHSTPVNDIGEFFVQECKAPSRAPVSN